jgi:hypothetical protein
MIFAACVLVALAASSGSQSAPSSLAMKRFARQQELQAEGNETTLEGEGEGEGEAASGGMPKVPAMPKIDFSWDKIRFPTTWAALHVSFFPKATLPHSLCLSHKQELQRVQEAQQGALPTL